MKLPTITVDRLGETVRALTASSTVGSTAERAVRGVERCQAGCATSLPVCVKMPPAYGQQWRARDLAAVPALNVATSAPVAASKAAIRYRVVPAMLAELLST